LSKSYDLRIAPAVASMRSFIEPHSGWIENALGCTMSQSVTFEIDIPFGQFAAESLLEGVPLDRRCLPAASVIGPMIAKWELPENLSPRIELSLSHVQGTQLSSKVAGWDPHWRDCPLAIWLRDVTHAVVSVQIPYVSLAGGISADCRNWLLVNRADIPAALEKLAVLLQNLPKRLFLLGGRTLERPTGGYNWDSLVLDKATNGDLRRDFELFFEREDWFRRHGLPFRRGYLFYGPPGNGKTTAIRVMASHPAVAAYTIDFYDERADNEAMNSLFEAARQAAPSLVIFEDLDRVFGGEGNERRVRVSLQHFLNCLDGVGSQDGVIVTATANNPDVLDAAILRRPGRFDRVIPFRAPSHPLREEYFRRLSLDSLRPEDLHCAAAESEGLSFAQLREAFILAGWAAFGQELTVQPAELISGIRSVRSDGAQIRLGSEGRNTGFGIQHGEAMAV
jgi:ATPase family protein associated with various cellular activities (AAA)